MNQFIKSKLIFEVDYQDYRIKVHDCLYEVITTPAQGIYIKQLLMMLFLSIKPEPYTSSRHANKKI